MHCGDSPEVGSMWKNNFLSIAPWLLSLTTDSKIISFVTCKLILTERSFIYYLVIILRHNDKKKQENNAVS